jgi:hypothetical protein
MKDGEILSIYIRPKAGQPVLSIDQVRAVPGRGLEGDHYYYSSETTKTPEDSSREVTLIEFETLQAAKRDYELAGTW